MVLISPVTRMGHSEGHTDVCYEESGKYILTCGSDGDVRIWQGLDDDDPQSVDVGETTSALALKKGRLFTASDTNTVQAHTFPDGQSDGIITRFTAPVTHFTLSPEGSRLVAGASDFSIKVINMEDSSQKVLEGHSAPVLSVAIDPKLEYVASSSCDGTLKIWNLADESWEKSVSLIPKCSDVSLSKTLCRLAWKPGKGELLAVPVEKEIQMYERETWDLAFSLIPGEESGGFVSVVAWSPCGNFLASANTDGTICFWDIGSKKCIESTKHKKGLSICGLAWNPTGNQSMAFTDIMGQVGVFEDVIPSDTTKVSQEVQDDLVADLFDDAADEDLLAAVTQAENDHMTNQNDEVRDELDAMLDDDDDDDPIHAEIRKAKKKVAMLMGDDQSIDSTSNIGDTASVSDITDIVPPKLPAPEGSRLTPMQKPFIPASTPVHLSSRFMKWNSVAIVRCYDTDEESSIDVEFHDTAIHHALHFDNQLNHTMADVSMDTVLLGCESNNENPSQLLCYHFASWDNQKEWMTAMPKGENIKCLTIGAGWVAVATDKRLIRLYSTGGIQKEIFSLSGPVICMAGHDKQIMVAYHAGIGVPGDQCIGVKLMSVMGKKRKVELDGHLPISPKATLSWFGFSNEGTPASVDSEGIVRLLNRSIQSWTPVANTKNHSKGRSDHHWVVGIHENQQQVRCIPCKGAPFPPTLPRPAVTILPLQMPLCDLSTEKGQMEEAYWRAQLLSQHFQHTNADDINEMALAKMDRDKQDNLMKLFALACRTEREFRASEICQLMTSQQALSLAIKYASRSRRMALAQRLSDMASRLMEEEEEEEEEEETVYQPTVRYSKPDPGRSVRPVTQKPQTNHQDDEDDDEEEEEEDDNGEQGEDEEEEMEQDEEEEEAPKLTLKPKKDPIPSILPGSQGRRNPFKKSAPSQSSKSPTSNPKGCNVFDEMKKSPRGAAANKKSGKESNPKGKPTKVTKQKGKQQATLFKSTPKGAQNKTEKKTTDPPKEVKKAPSAFNFWLSENRESISEENPELAGSEIIKLAMQRWRELSEDEKKDWGEKAAQSVAKQPSETENKDVTNGVADKKRKRVGEEDEDENSNTEKKAKPGRPKKIGQEGKKQPLTSATNAKLASFAFSKN